MLGVTLRLTHAQIATDSPSTELQRDIATRGWTLLDHDAFGTVDRYDAWMPALLDACILSRSVGFVGTHRSTYSIYSWLRTESWQGGVGTEYVAASSGHS